MTGHGTLAMPGSPRSSETEGELVATAIATLEIGVPTPSAPGADTVCLANVITLREHRGHGHGTMPARDVASWARSIAADHVDVSATPPRAAYLREARLHGDLSTAHAVRSLRARSGDPAARLPAETTASPHDRAPEAARAPITHFCVPEMLIAEAPAAAQAVTCAGVGDWGGWSAAEAACAQWVASGSLGPTLCSAVAHRGGRGLRARLGGFRSTSAGRPPA